MKDSDPAPDPEAHRRIGECIAATLRAEVTLEKDDSWVIKAWLGRVIGIYRDVPAVAEVSEERVRDRQESPEVRLGCLAALGYCRPTERVLGLFRELAGDADQVARQVRWYLTRWGRA